MVFYSIFMALVVVTGYMQSEELSLPDIQRPMPQNEEAAEQTSEFLSIMDKYLFVAAELGRLEALDQYSRDVLISRFQYLVPGSDAFEAYRGAVAPYLDDLDEGLARDLRVLLDKVTWRELVVHELDYEAALNIVKHSKDIEFKEHTLLEIEALVKEGLVAGGDYASLVDTIRMESGQPQLYGTRIKCVDGKAVAFDLEDPEGVEQRRQTLGMIPLYDHLQRINDSERGCNI